jgi:flavin reductase (DIM6/NTAB) family NADH-FMN oxidoreductase RutF
MSSLFKEIAPTEITENAVKLIGTDWMLLTAGTLSTGFNAMTASWGMIGHIWQKPVAFIMFRPSRYTLEFVERNPTVTISFFPPQFENALTLLGTKSGRDGDKIKESGLTPYDTGLGVAYTEAKLVLAGKKLYADWLKPENFIDQTIAPAMYPEKDWHKVFIIEIEKVWVKA